MAKIPRHDATAVTLGRSLATFDSRYFVAGAYLLVAAQETDAYPALRRELQRREAINRDDYNEIAQIRSEDFDTLLAWMDASEARRQLLPISFNNGFSGPTWASSAAILASHGDLRGFDDAFQRMAAPSSVGNELQSMELQLKGFFRWPDNAPYFREWYQSIRPRLKSGQDQNGQLAFWLDEGKPFDPDYFASMPKPLTAAP